MTYKQIQFDDPKITSFDFASFGLVQELFDIGGAQPLEDPGAPFQRFSLWAMIRIRRSQNPHLVDGYMGITRLQSVILMP